MSELSKRYTLLVANGTTVIDVDQSTIKVIGGVSEVKVDATMLRRAEQDYNPELQYLALLQELVEQDTVRPDRTGVGTYSVFGRSMQFDLTDGQLPVVTTKKVFLKAVIAELAWMLRGDTNIRQLDATIWNEWADEAGELGPVYGRQWRNWAGIDQISELIANLRANPHSRRHVVSAWNVQDLPKMALAPCHCLFQFYVDHEGRLDCQLYQRSADIFLGVPFNLTSYALLTHLVAQAAGLKPGRFIHTFGDLHLYSNHVEQAREQLSRTPKSMPSVRLLEDVNLFDLDPSKILIENYDPHPTIKGDVAI